MRWYADPEAKGCGALPAMRTIMGLLTLSITASGAGCQRNLMDLIIVRHAIACTRDPQRWPDDRERPLSPAGVSRARRAARGLGHLIDPPSRVLASPLTRALDTAAILSADAGWPCARVCMQLSPEVSPEALFAVLCAERSRRIAVVGHQPQLGGLLAYCLPGAAQPSAFQLKKSGVALLVFDGVARAGGATLRALLPAVVLRAVRCSRG